MKLELFHDREYDTNILVLPYETSVQDNVTGNGILRSVDFYNTGIKPQRVDIDRWRPFGTLEWDDNILEHISTRRQQFCEAWQLVGLKRNALTYNDFRLQFVVCDPDDARRVKFPKSTQALLRNPEKWESLPIGRFLRRLNDNHIYRTNEQTRENIARKWGGFTNLDKFKLKLLSGHLLRRAYTDGPESCLQARPHLTRLFTRNPDKCGLLIVLNEGRIIARALQWLTDNGRHVVDRIYPNDAGTSWERLIHNYAKEHEMWVRNGNQAEFAGWKDPVTGGMTEGELELSLWSDGRNDMWPFLDSFYLIKEWNPKEELLTVESWNQGILGPPKRDRFLIQNANGEPFLICDGCKKPMYQQFAQVSEWIEHYREYGNAERYCQKCGKEKHDSGEIVLVGDRYYKSTDVRKCKSCKQVTLIHSRDGYDIDNAVDCNGTPIEGCRYCIDRKYFLHEYEYYPVDQVQFCKHCRTFLGMKGEVTETVCSYCDAEKERKKRAKKKKEKLWWDVDQFGPRREIQAMEDEEQRDHIEQVRDQIINDLRQDRGIFQRLVAGDNRGE